MATTTNGVFLTSTNQASYESPFQTFNTPQQVAFSETIADGDMDAIGDVTNLVEIPQGAKILYFYYEVADHDDGGQTDMDFQLVTVSGGTTTTTTLLNGATLGQAAATAFVLPAVDTAYLHETTVADSGVATFRLYQNAAVTTDKASSIKGFIVYR